MTPDQIKELFENDITDKHCIGVKNVNDRIKIYFGEQYGITVESEPDEGTTVSIRIPKITEEDHYEKR
jgi:two-component system sensor histidine kinase YesM